MTVDAVGAQIPAEVSQRYRATVPLYAGSTGVLYEGTDPATGRAVVVKVLREAALPSTAERQRVLRELQKLSQVRHAALVTVLASGDTQGRVWIVRERVQGQNVGEMLAARGPMPPGLVARVAAQVAAGLGELHRNGVLHRDVRAGHVMMESSGQVRLIDAAVARMVRLPDGRSLAGSPGYVAPEAIAGKLVSFRSDLYALGALMFELLHGEPPYGPPDTPGILRAQSEQDAPLVRVPAPLGLSRLIASLLSREPRERPFSAQQLERQLEPLAAADTAGDDAVEQTMAEDSEDMTTMVPQTAETRRPPDDVDEVRADEATTIVPEMSEISRSRMAPAATPKAGDFEEDMPTRVGDSPRVQSAPAMQAPVSSGPLRANSSPSLAAMAPRSVSSSAINAPSGRTNSSPGMLAPTAGPPRKSTVLGMPSPLTTGATGSAPRMAAAQGAAPAMAAPPMSKPLEGSGRIQRPAPDQNDFDESGDTVVTEDSRIFGVPEVSGGSPHGSAVPPLPDAVAARVLTGAVRTDTAGFGQTPGARAPGAMPAAAIAAPPGGMAPYGAAFGPGQPPTMPRPMAPPAGPPRAPAAGPPGWAGPPPAAGPPMAPTAWPGGQSQNATGAGGYPMPGGPPMMPGPHAAPPPQQAWGPPPAAGPYGAPPQGYGAQQYPGAPAPYRPQQLQAPVASRRGILPWVLAGIGVAGLAGAAGYYFASRDHGAASPAGVGGTVPTTGVPVPLVPSVTPGPVPVPVGVVPPAVAAVPGARSAPPVVAPPLALPRQAPPPVAVAPPVPAPAPAAVAPPVVAPVAVAPPAIAPAPVQRPVAAPHSSHASAPVAPPAASAPRASSLALAHAAYDRRDYAQARSLAAAAAREQPSNAEPHVLMSDVLARQSDGRGSLGEMRTATRLAPRNADYLRRLAVMQLDQFDRAGAIASFRQILAINPRDAAARRQLDSLGGGGQPAPATNTSAPAPAPRPAPTRPAPSTTPSRPRPADPFVPTFGAPMRPSGAGRAGSIRR